MRAGTVVVLVLLSGQVVGCAATRKDEARSAENLLIASGFKARPADTAEKLAQLEALPPLKMQERSRNGQLRYSYADPYSCKCLYVGGPSQYAEYQSLAVKQQIASEKAEAAKTKEDDYLDWGPWGEELQQ